MKKIVSFAFLSLLISAPAMAKGDVWYALDPNYSVAPGLCATTILSPQQYAQTLFKYSNKKPHITPLENGRMIVVYFHGGGPYTTAFFKDQDECQAYLAMERMFEHHQ